MSEIIKVYSVTDSGCGALLIDADFIGTVTGQRMLEVYALRDGDEFGSAPMFRQWAADNNPEILPYTPPPIPTPEELRAQMPPLTRRQFWLGANSLDLSKANVMAATDDPVILIEIEESGEFYRFYESILMLSNVLGITPEQLDDVWMWWASA